MDELKIRRFGDLSARRWHVPVVTKLLIPIVPTFIVVTLVVTSRYWFDVHDVLHILGAVIGISIGLTVVAAAAIFWLVYWGQVSRAMRAVKHMYPNSIVLSGRLPTLSEELRAGIWPSHADEVPTPQRVIVSFDLTRIAIFNVKKPTGLIEEVPWSQVVDVIRAEFVEADVAYEGIAIVGPSNEFAIVIQVTSVSLPVVRFPTGKSLELLIAEIRALGRDARD